MKHKNFYLIFLIFILGSSFILASQPAPDTATCEIKGIIESITFKEAYNDSCLERGIEFCQPGISPYYNEKYVIGLKIKEINFVSFGTSLGEGDQTCSSLYSLDQGIQLTISPENFNEQDKNEIGKLITTKIPNKYYRIISEYTISEPPLFEEENEEEPEKLSFFQKLKSWLRNLFGR